jgi:putative N6-adenine-specific DNA methylase
MKFVAKTLFGLENVLSDELASLGAENINVVNRAVLFSGDKELLYKVNYCSHTALSVLVPVAEFRIRSVEDLYRRAMKVEWEKFLDVEDTFSIVSVVNSRHFSHSGYAGLKLKDAIVDSFRNMTGKRPSVDSLDPVLLINLHISNDLVTISFDSSVIPLFKRGYRQDQAGAPLNEVLAAGILKISGWDPAVDLIDPMCGSGTISIEAGLIATNTPPGKFRKYFGFQRWKDYDADMFENLKLNCDKKVLSPSKKLYASDISSEAVSAAKLNISVSGLSDFIDVSVIDFRDTKAFSEGNMVFLNPPYGRRLQEDDLDSLYSMIGATLKHNYTGTIAWLITSNKGALKNIGLRPKEKYVLFNGALECALLKYEMYAGTLKNSINKPKSS